MAYTSKEHTPQRYFKNEEPTTIQNLALNELKKLKMARPNTLKDLLDPSHFEIYANNGRYWIKPVDPNDGDEQELVMMVYIYFTESVFITTIKEMLDAQYKFFNSKLSFSHPDKQKLLANSKAIETKAKKMLQKLSEFTQTEIFK